jgi:hypothetical protein
MSATLSIFVKGDLADVIKLSTLRGDVILAYLGDPSVIARGFIRGTWRESEKGQVMMKTETEMLHFEDRGRDYKA